ncbi:hypothetical protein IE077_001500 [Cardiosporidium cionae]|uniref:ER lumen protein retaining receptor n=1 Tax=Cardiosporidium cionae TaxID=476202 RepID=A0ABQ7JCQ7_9APIC|nr:hypothetical protein IE077_001500 [Cardiosporidium cionae]|eukprot:KAF8821828.1 hypothetical protein IE077_001500 [Cardiosporidium cionae]
MPVPRVWLPAPKVILEAEGIRKMGAAYSTPSMGLSHIIFVHSMLSYASAFLWIIAYVALYQKLYQEKSAAGISLQSLIAFCFVELSEVFLLFINSKYIRFSFGYCISVCSAAFVSSAALIHTYRNFISSYDWKKDGFGRRFSTLVFPAFLKRFYWLFLYLLAFALSIPFTVYRRADIPIVLSFLECFNDSIIAIALLPQLHMFYSSNHRAIKGLLGRFVICLLLARIFSFVYWLLYPSFYSIFPTGRGIHLLTDSLNVLILADFTYYFIKAKLQRMEDIDLPT